MGGGGGGGGGGGPGRAGQGRAGQTRTERRAGWLGEPGAIDARDGVTHPPPQRACSRSAGLASIRVDEKRPDGGVRRAGHAHTLSAPCDGTDETRLA